MKILDLSKKPLIIAIVAFLVGAFFGLVVLGWGIWPVEWKDADPSLMYQDYAVDYLRMVIDSYQLKPDEFVALERYQAMGALGPKTIEILLQSNDEIERVRVENFSNLMDASAVLYPASAKTSVEEISIMGKIAIIVIILCLVGVVGFFIVKYFKPLLARAQRQQPKSNQGISPIDQAQLTNYEALGEEPPIAQFMTTYVMGDDLFDDSFSIEGQSGEFLGECGIGISETIGVGDPKKVTAFEVWLFDKNDIQTETKVLMSEHAFSDPPTFQRMEAKGEPIIIEPGKQVVLETKALQLVTLISDMKYAEGPLPEKSYFDRLTLELAIWPKINPPE